MCSKVVISVGPGRKWPFLMAWPKFRDLDGSMGGPASAAPSAVSDKSIVFSLVQLLRAAAGGCWWLPRPRVLLTLIDRLPDRLEKVSFFS